MSGIAENAQNKFETCQGCKDRSVEPNCHMTCEGYKFRQKKNEEERKKRQQENTFIAFKRKVVGEMIEKVNI